MSESPRIFKLAAAGNDFLVVDARAHPGFEWSADEARLACRRNRGIGADGVVTLGASTAADATFSLRNCDGSRAAYSGNGARCAARLLAHLGAGREGALTLETSGGVVAARVANAPSGAAGVEVDVEIAPPRDVRLDVALPAGSPASRGDCAIVGVPYLALAVTESPGLDALDLPLVGPPLRHWRELPEGANVAFYERPSRGGDAPVRLRIYERGVEAETLSSGTGCAMVASVLALREPADGERCVRLATRSRAPLSVTVTMARGAITRLVLHGDALLLGEIHAGADLFVPDP